LQELHWIEEVEVLNVTQVDVAYSWHRPGSRWVPDITRQLEANNIYPAGRFARWSVAYGIADSISDAIFTALRMKV
jgi:hypothetical protein